MKWTALGLVTLAFSACTATPATSCEEQLKALTNSVNWFSEASRQAAQKDAVIRKLQAELDKLKAPSTPKAPSKPEAPGQ